MHQNICWPSKHRGHQSSLFENLFIVQKHAPRMSDEDIDEPVSRARKNKPLTKTAGCDYDRDLYVLLTCALLGYYRWQGGLLHCACAVCFGDCACACRRLLTTGRPAYDRNTTSRLVRSWCQSSSPARRTGFRGQTIPGTKNISLVSFRFWVSHYLR